MIVCDSAEAATARTIEMIAHQLLVKPASVLGLATGGTMERVYAGLVAATGAGLSFAEAVTFNLDEYVGLAPEHPQSYRSYMQRLLFDHVDIDPARTFVPLGDRDPGEAAVQYEGLLEAHGPVDLQLLGLGHNGHIGFNEPGSSLASRVREKTLTASTRAANRRYFDREDDVPLTAITMGIATIMEARRVVVLALGAGKAEAARRMIEGPVTSMCPGSALQYHQNAAVVLDTFAAAGLELAEHYREAEWVRQQRGMDP